MSRKWNNKWGVEKVGAKMRGVCAKRGNAEIAEM